MNKPFKAVDSWVAASPWHGTITILFFLSVFFWLLVSFVHEFSIGGKLMYWTGLMIVTLPLPWFLPKQSSFVDSPALLPENAKFSMYRDENGIYVIRSDSRPYFVRCGETPDEVVQKMADAIEAEKGDRR